MEDKRIAARKVPRHGDEIERVAISLRVPTLLLLLFLLVGAKFVVDIFFHSVMELWESVGCGCSSLVSRRGLGIRGLLGA